LPPEARIEFGGVANSSAHRIVKAVQDLREATAEHQLVSAPRLRCCA
jgi:hypothetical protein